ncbi:MAG: hypothetical protein E7582_01090 [Ruminococcaceae bacterium]|nr:hypothetical protein [Oscillospiraceae bacterium]
MKKRTVVTLSLILILSLIMPTLSSCSKNTSPVVFAYGDAVMNENMYYFELAMMKSQIVEEYTGSTTDVPALWSQPLGEGLTFDDYIYAQCQLNICKVLYFADYALKNGGELTKEDKKVIDESLEKYLSNFGSKAAMNKYLETYNINYDMYREYLELYSLHSKGISLAYSDNGKRAITYEDMYEYYEKNFVSIKHIAIGTEYLGLDENGEYIYYTEEEKKEKRDLISNITASLEKGDDFDEYYKLSEDGFYETYPDGYTITKGVLDSKMSGYEEVALSLEIGETKTYELEGVCTYIIKRVPLLEKDFSNCRNTIHSTLMQIDMGSAVIENYDDFTMNQEIIDMYNMAMVPVLK